MLSFDAVIVSFVDDQSISTVRADVHRLSHCGLLSLGTSFPNTFADSLYTNQVRTVRKLIQESSTGVNVHVLYVTMWNPEYLC